MPMAGLDIVAVLSAAGGSVVYITTRLEQRSLRSRLKGDLELLSKAPAGSPTEAILREICDAQAQDLRQLSPSARRATTLRRAFRVFVVSLLLGLGVGVVYLFLRWRMTDLIEAAARFDAGGASPLAVNLGQLLEMVMLVLVGSAVAAGAVCVILLVRQALVVVGQALEELSAGGPGRFVRAVLTALLVRTPTPSPGPRTPTA
jgi:hypothetical protein